MSDSNSVPTAASPRLVADYNPDPGPGDAVPASPLAANSAERGRQFRDALGHRSMEQPALGHPSLGKPALGPRIGPGEAKTPRRRGADYYDTVLWRVMPQGGGGDAGFAVGLTSGERRAGVSTVAANLAIRAADHRLSPVVLVDANLQHPRVERQFRLYDAPGLTETLAEECDLVDAIHESGVEGLSVMPLGSQALVDRTRVDPESLAALVTELRGEFSTIVFDLPEAAELRHSLLLAQQCDATLLVVRCNGTSRRQAESAAGRLAADGVNVIGSVVTQHKTATPGWLKRWL